MILTDVFSNLFSNIVNGSLSGKSTIQNQKSKKIINLLTLLTKEGLINGFKLSETDLNKLSILLKYKNDRPIIKKIKRISKPGRRIYIKNKCIHNDLKKDIYILSTSKGFITQNEAKISHLGGEIICQIQIF